MSRGVPDGQEGLIPQLAVVGASEAIDFYKKAFGAVEESRASTPDGEKVLHATLLIDGRPIYVNDDFPEYGDGKATDPKALGGSPVKIHRFVEDVDAAVKVAEEAGATVTMPPDDMFWGDRWAELTDPFGHQWSLATHVRDVTPEELDEAAAKMFGG